MRRIRSLAWVSVVLAATVLAEETSPDSAPPSSPSPAGAARAEDPLGSADSPGAWDLRRRAILLAMEQVMGPLPAKWRDLPLDFRIESEERVDGLMRKKVSFRADPHDRVPAWLLLPATPSGKAAAVLCLHQTTDRGKDQPAGLDGNPDLYYAKELALRGFVTLAPDAWDFGEYRGKEYDPYAHGYVSGTMKAIWNHFRAVEVLRSLEEVDPERVGAIGHSLGGHNALWLAAFDPRVKAVVSSCGFNSFRAYAASPYGGGSLKGYAQRRYMPRVASVYGSDPARMPFEWGEVLAAIAPRPIFVNAPEGDENFVSDGVRECVRAALPVYRLFGREEALAVVHPRAGHEFPLEVRNEAYAFLEEALRPPAPSAPVLEPPGNILENPGFERHDGTQAESWSPFEMGYAVDVECRRSGKACVRVEARSMDDRGGAMTVLTLDQRTPAPILVAGWSRADGVGGFPNNDYSVYVDLEYTDGTPLWGQTAPFDCGTHDWQRREVFIIPRKPIRTARVYALFRHHTGTARFDDLSVLSLRPDDLFDGQRLAPPELPPGADAGLFVRDVAADSPILLLAALPLGRGGAAPAAAPGASPAESALRLGIEDLAVHASGDVSAFIADRAGRERAVTVYYVERFEGEGLEWAHDIRERVPAGEGGEVANLARLNVGSTGYQSLYPFGCVTARGGEKGPGRGRMLGIPPSQNPCVARIGFHPSRRLFSVALDLALTGRSERFSDGKGRGRVPLRVVRAEVDARWGFRDAAREYYERFPKEFERRAGAEGIWIPFTNPATIPRVEDFGIAYHEGDGDLAGDDRLGILSFRYTEPMTWWMPMAKGTPRTIEAALGIVEAHASGTDAGQRRRAEVLWNSGARDLGGRLRVEFQSAPWTDGAVWALNPDPRLGDGEGKREGDAEAWTQARWNYPSEHAARAYPAGNANGVGLDGEYLDSIEGWADVLDYGDEAIRRSSVPATFARPECRPVLPLWFEVHAFAAHVSADLRARGRLLMANSTPWRIHAFAPLLDVMGTETNWMPGGRWMPDSDAVFNLRRTLCFHKPYLLLQNTDFDRFGAPEVEKYFRRCLFYGVFPSMFSIDASTRPYWGEPRWYERDRPLFKTYIPAIAKLSREGWEPLTFARSDAAKVYVERYGKRTWTVLNDSREAARATLEIEGPSIGFPGGGGALLRDLVTDEVSAESPSGSLRFELSLAPDEARAFRLEPKEAGPGR